MQKSPLQFTSFGAPNHSFAPTSRLCRLADEWFSDCKIRRHSPHTIELPRIYIKRLEWFLQDRNATECGRIELRHLFAYLSNGHQDPTGRLAKGQHQQWTSALKPASVGSYLPSFKSILQLVSE